MAQEELEYEIRQWQHKIDSYNSTIRNNNYKIEEFEDIRMRLCKKADEMESGLDSTLRLISNKLNGIYDCDKFKKNYYENVKSILYNSSTNSAIEETRQAIAIIKEKCYEIDGDNDLLRNKISYAKAQISRLKERIRREVILNEERGNQG